MPRVAWSATHACEVRGRNRLCQHRRIPNFLRGPSQSRFGNHRGTLRSGPRAASSPILIGARHANFGPRVVFLDENDPFSQPRFCPKTTPFRCLPTDICMAGADKYRAERAQSGPSPCLGDSVALVSFPWSRNRPPGRNRLCQRGRNPKFLRGPL